MSGFERDIRICCDGNMLYRTFIRNNYTIVEVYFDVRSTYTWQKQIFWTRNL
jgi:hypothetical protein